MSKATDCFQIDNTEGSYLAVYDAAREQRTYFATRWGVSSQVGKSAIRVPLFEFTDVEIHDRCVLLLLEAANNLGWRRKRAYEDAEMEFERRGYRMMTMLSSSDHHLIPPGRRLAVAEPEQVGRIVVASGQRGVCLFNPEAVIGYDGLGRTSYEYVLQDYLAA